MFTGLVEDVGRVVSLVSAPGGRVVAVQTRLVAELREGESVAVNGVCLTVARLVEPDVFQADIGPETARVTTLGSLEAGQGVNLERSMRADGRFGGHFVLGHVDGVGRVAALRQEGEATWMTVECPPVLEPLLVPKGSVAVDGISLTVARLAPGAFDVMIVPFTWTHTTLSSRRTGDQVNLECDVVGKYVVRSLELQSRER